MKLFPPLKEISITEIERAPHRKCPGLKCHDWRYRASF